MKILNLSGKFTRSLLLSTQLTGLTAIRATAEEQPKSISAQKEPAPFVPQKNKNKEKDNVLLARKAYTLAKEHIDSGQASTDLSDKTIQYSGAIKTIQEGLFDNENIILFIEGEHIRSHNLAHKLIKLIPEENRNFSSYETNAEKMLDEIIREGNIANLEKLFKRYPYTKSGVQAGFLFVKNMVDLGRTEYLHNFFTSELKDPFLLKNNSFTPSINVYAAHLFAQVGDKENFEIIAGDLEKNFSTNTISLAGKDFPISVIVKKLREYLNKNVSKFQEHMKLYKLSKEMENRDVLIGNLFFDSFVKIEVKGHDKSDDKDVAISSTLLPDKKTILVLSSKTQHMEYYEFSKKKFTDLDGYTGIFHIAPNSNPYQPPIIFPDKKKSSLYDAVITKDMFGVGQLAFTYLDIYENQKTWFTLTHQSINGIKDNSLIDSLTNVPNERLFLATTKEGNLVLVSPPSRDGKIKPSFDGMSIIKLGERISTPTFHPNGKNIFITNSSGILHVLKIENNKLIKISELKYDGRTMKPFVFPCGKKIAVTSKKKIHIIEFSDNKLREIANKDFENNVKYEPIDVSLDGKYLAVSSYENAKLAVFRMTGNSLIELGTFTPTKESSTDELLSYKPIFLSDNKTIAFPVTTTNAYTKIYLVQVDKEEKLTLVKETNIKTYVNDRTYISHVKSNNESKEDTLIIGCEIFNFINLKLPENFLKPVSFLEEK